MSITKKLLIGGALAVTSALAIEMARWYIAGKHSTWVILNDPTAASVAIAADLDAFRMLAITKPSKAWAAYYEDHPSEATALGDRRIDESELKNLVASGRIKKLPNGTRAEEMRGRSTSNVIRAVRIKVRDGPSAGTEGWTLPEVVQHEVAWP